MMARCEPLESKEKLDKDFKIPCLSKLNKLILHFSEDLDIRCPEFPEIQDKIDRGVGGDSNEDEEAIYRVNLDTTRVVTLSPEAQDSDEHQSSTTRELSPPVASIPNEDRSPTPPSPSSEGTSALPETKTGEPTPNSNSEEQNSAEDSRFKKPLPKRATREAAKSDIITLQTPKSVKRRRGLYDEPEFYDSGPSNKAATRNNPRDSKLRRSRRDAPTNGHRSLPNPIKKKPFLNPDLIDTGGFVDETIVSFLPEFCQRLKRDIPEDPMDLCASFKLDLPDCEIYKYEDSYLEDMEACELGDLEQISETGLSANGI